MENNKFDIPSYDKGYLKVYVVVVALEKPDFYFWIFSFEEKF